ncbi:pilus assembly protein TadG-related protein [Brevibacterium permense]|uniref:Putative Flp pilus-assembly TadG-like N-terminal domain-containing protein n=1 Tax=Brevibacterium permense TaxID=234834 RepID=A0ABN2AE08_9MICO|nr:pilus assembly protein TadG-related protein [Brevibacterium permense]
MPTAGEHDLERCEDSTRGQESDHASDAGSITPLAIGFVVIALLLAFLIAALTDLHMARRELQGLADSAALAASDSFEPAPGDDPGLLFSPPAAKRAAGRYLDAVPTPKDMGNLRLSADADGTHSVHIRIEARYSPALLSPFVPGLIDLHATAYARGALRLD